MLRFWDILYINISEFLRFLHPHEDNRSEQNLIHGSTEKYKPISRISIIITLGKSQDIQFQWKQLKVTYVDYPDKP